MGENPKSNEGRWKKNKKKHRTYLVMRANKKKQKNIAGSLFFLALEMTWGFLRCFFYLLKLSHLFFFGNRQQSNAHLKQIKI